MQGGRSWPYGGRTGKKKKWAGTYCSTSCAIRFFCVTWYHSPCWDLTPCKTTASLFGPQHMPTTPMWEPARNRYPNLAKRTSRLILDRRLTGVWRLVPRIRSRSLSAASRSHQQNPRGASADPRSWTCVVPREFVVGGKAGGVRFVPHYLFATLQKGKRKD